jgi:hypothetical protein
MGSRISPTVGVLVIGAAGLLCGGLGFSMWRLWETCAALQAAERNLAACRELAAKIVDLNGHPTTLADVPAADTSITTQINQAVLAAQIPSDKVTAIDPQPSQTVGDSGVRRQTLVVDFAQLSVPQAIQFLHELHRLDPHWWDTHLGFSAVGSRETTATSAEGWSVQVILTRLSYSPITRDTP